MILLRILQFLERKRIQLHLIRTEYWLRSKDTSHLTTYQKQNRNKVLKSLHDYWKQNIFPINTTHKEKIPQIRDKRGTPCALAYILQNSGKQKLVDDVSQQSNYVLVDDIPNNHPLNYAIKESGISKKEAAKIQPMYGNCLILANNAPLYEPAWMFLTMIMSITGIAITLSVYRVSEKSNLKSIVVVAIVGTLVSSAVFVGFYQDTSAYSFSDYPGTMEVYSMDETHSVFYWISGGQVTTISSEYGGVLLNIEASNDGEITVALPGVSYENRLLEESDFFVLINGEEIRAEQTFESQHYIMTFPFDAGKHEIELIGSGLCRYEFSDKELKDYP